jgi:hypothetical protein
MWERSTPSDDKFWACFSRFTKLLVRVLQLADTLSLGLGVFTGKGGRPVIGTVSRIVVHVLQLADVSLSLCRYTSEAEKRTHSFNDRNPWARGFLSSPRWSYFAASRGLLTLQVHKLPRLHNGAFLLDDSKFSDTTVRNIWPRSTVESAIA